MSALTDLQSAWTTEIAKIADTLLKAKATYLLTTYIAALENQASLESREITSYSIAGRTINFKSASSGKAMINAMERELQTLIYGSTSLVDMAGNY